MPEVPTLRPSCIRSTGSQKFSSQSFSVRGCCCRLSPSSPKLESPVSSQLGLAFNLEIKFSTCQHFYFCKCPGYFLNWDRGNGNTSVRSLQFQGEVEMFQAHSPQHDEIADDPLPTEADSCLAWQTPLPLLHVGLQLSLLMP